MRVFKVISAALGGIILGFGFGFWVHSEFYPQPGIEFDSPMNEIVSDTEVFWYADLNGHYLICDSLRVDKHVGGHVLFGKTEDGVLHVTVPSLHRFPTESVSVDRCYVHRVGE